MKYLVRIDDNKSEGYHKVGTYRSLKRAVNVADSLAAYVSGAEVWAVYKGRLMYRAWESWT